MNRFRSRYETALVGIGYAASVVLMTWPALRFLDQQIIGKDSDVWIFFWNDWWFREAINNGYDLFQTPFLFYPSGTSLIAHSNSFLSSFMASLLEPLVGSVAAYNLVLLIGLWLGAMGMYLLVKDITDNVKASFFAGFVFAFAPYHISQVLAHPHLGSIHWLPYFALFLRRTLQLRRWRDAFATGFFGALTLWSGLQLAVFLALWAVFYIMFSLWQMWVNLHLNRALLLRIVGLIWLISLVVMLLSMPIFLSIISNWFFLADSAQTFNEGLDNQTDLLAYLVPPRYQSFWGDEFESLHSQLGLSRNWPPYIGFAVIILVLSAVKGIRKEALFWFLSGGLWLLLAAGSALRINGIVYDGIQLPYHYLGTLFPISGIRSPERFNLLIVFSFAVLTGIGAAYLATHRFLRWVIWPIGLLIVIEYLVIPIPRFSLPKDSTFLHDMKSDGDYYAIIDYPMGYKAAQSWLYYQTLHGKPTVEGHVSRYTEDTYSYIANQPILNALYNRSDQPELLPEDYFSSQASPLIALGPAIRELQEVGVRYILLHRSSTSESQLEHFESVLPLIPTYQDELLTIYDLRQPRPFLIGRPPVPLSYGVILVQGIVQYEATESRLEVGLLTQLIRDVDESEECHLHLNGTQVSKWFSILPSKADWRPGDLVYQKLNLAVPTDLSPGQYELQIICPNEIPYIYPDKLFIGNGPLRLLGNEVYLQYGDAIRLEGYRWWTEQSDLHVAFRWQAQAKIDKDYKVFIHLIDDNGVIVRQHDALHCNWECPTSTWTSGQIIDDDADLSLLGLPAGEYRLAVGLYDEITGDRLPVYDETGQKIPDEFYVLDEIITIATTEQILRPLHTNPQS